jgi:PASTA domain
MPGGSSDTRSIETDDWRVTLGPHGVVISRFIPAAPPSSRARPGDVLPEPIAELLGRNSDIDRILDALRAEARVEMWGGCGIGKTSVLRRLAHRAVTEFDRPVVYLSARRLPREDLLQELYLALREPPSPIRPAPASLRHLLAPSGAVVLLDDLDLADADVADLLRSLPNSLVAFTRQTRALDPANGQSIQLRGLDPRSAGDLVRRRAGPLTDHRQDAAAGELGQILAGHPLRLCQAAAIVTQGRQTPENLVRRMARRDPTEVLNQELQSALSPEQRRIVGVLAAAAGFLLPISLVEDMVNLGTVVAKLRDLADRHVIDRQHDRYGLPSCALGDPQHLFIPAMERAIALRGLVEWMRRPEMSIDEILSVSGGILTLLEFASDAAEWESVIAIVRAVEPALILGGHWEQWQSALETGLHAANTIHDTASHAYFAHELGSRAVTLFEPDARRLLDEAKTLRGRIGEKDGEKVTAGNLRLLAVRSGWQRPTAVVAAVVVLMAAVAGIASAVRPHTRPLPGPTTTSSAGPVTSSSSGPHPLPPAPTSATTPGNATTTPPGGATTTTGTTTTTTTTGTTGTTTETTTSVFSTTPTTTDSTNSPVLVPTVTGQTVAVAQRMLYDVGLVGYPPRDADATSIVEDQDPPAGSAVTKGSRVALTVVGAGTTGPAVP